MSFSYIRELSKLKASKEVLSKILSRKYHLPSKMKCVLLNEYADSVAELKPELEYICPTEEDLKPNEALIKVHAASVNPVDLEMMKGFGRKPINILRTREDLEEFPLILGRDFAGVVVACGKKFQRFEPGEEVYGVSGICRQGTHAEYVKVNKHELSPKPSNIDFSEAASLPAIACIAWSVFVESGVLAGQKPKRILIPGGSGGFGTYATQFCQLLGHDVITTCHNDAIPLLEHLGIKNVIDFKSATYENDLRSASPFDVALGTVKAASHVKLFQELLNPNLGSQFICMHSSLLEEADKQELMVGYETAVKNVLQFTINQIYTGKGLFRWGFCGLNGRILNNVKEYIDNGVIKPVIHKIFGIDSALDAYKAYESGKTNGKVIISMSVES